MTQHELPGVFAAQILTIADAIPDAIQDGGGVTDTFAADVRANAPLPSLSVMEVLLNESFYATLEIDEGRPTRFAVVYRNPDRAGGDELVLADAIPFTVENIRRLAPAIDRQHGSIVVYATAEGTRIWGLADQRSGLGMRLDAFGTGRLAVRYVHQECFSFERGRGRVRVAGDDNYWAVHTMVAELLGNGVEHLEYAAVLLRLATAIARGGHGGAILVSRDPKAEVGEGHLVLRYQADPPSDLLRRAVFAVAEFRRLRTGRIGASLDYELRSVLEEIPDSVAEAMREYDAAFSRTLALASVDGALLMSPTLRVEGFGATIVSPPAATVEQSQWPSLSAREPAQLKDAGGNRHQSAVNWCGASGGARIALVCSSDGGVTLIRREGNAVVFTKDVGTQA